jgi:hypothetical protein
MKYAYCNIKTEGGGQLRERRYEILCNLIYLLAIFLLLSGIIIAYCNKEDVSAVYQTDITEARQWLRENGHAFKIEELQINLSGTEKITGKLNWKDAKKLSYKGSDYIDISYVFPQFEKILPAGDKMPAVL